MLFVYIYNEFKKIIEDGRLLVNNVKRVRFSIEFCGILLGIVVRLDYVCFLVLYGYDK